jgi:quinol monooxygenase YgiN
VAIVLVFEGAGVTQAQYDQVGKEVSPDNKPPAGMLYHVAAPTAAGGFRVIEVWENQAAADKFFQEKLAQALQKANINVKPEVAQVHNIMKP